MTQDMLCNNIIRDNKQFSHLRARLSALLILMVMMTLGATGAWGQTDYSGIYYIGSTGYNASKTTSNYYLCPTEEWCYYQATDDFSSSDTGMPFLTTYQCRNGKYDDATKALWVIEKAPAPNSDYYYIKQWKTGRYLVANGVIRTTKDGQDRMRVHLEEIANLNEAGNKVLFSIGPYSTYLVISPKEIVDGANYTSHDGHGNHRWLTVNGGNDNHLTGVSGKTGGPTGYEDTKGVIGIYTQGDNNAKFYLEDASVAVPTFSMNGDGDVTISSVSGTTVYYTLDGTEPTTSSAVYSSAIPAASITSGNTVKAIAVRTSDGVSSAVGALPLVTYHIVNKSKAVAVSSKSYIQLAGTSLSGYASIPAEIQSQYISDETIAFYTMEGAFDAGNLDEEHRITEVPAKIADIYVTYTTDKLGEKTMRLQGARPFNIKHSDNYLYDDNGTLKTNGASESTNANHLWYFTGGDPYAVTVQNGETSSILTYKSDAFGYDGTAKTFIMKSTSVVDETHTNATLWYIDGENIREVTVTVNTVVLPRSYTLIDRKGAVIQANIAYVDAEGFGLPAAWKSPLAVYHYWNADAFVQTTQGTPDVPYVFVDANNDRVPDASEITSVTQVTSDNTIYVTYDVNKSLIDIEGKKTYLLKFSEGSSFNQEKGDALSTESTQAVYPYNNGDFNLNIYGGAQWKAQLGAGASERTRWLWYFVSNHDGTNLTGDDIDPYHVIVKSRQNQTTKDKDGKVTDGNTYLYTYKPNDAVGVVTGAISDHTAVTDAEPTEYMILGTSTSSMTLKTFYSVGGARQTVNRFEQYWKNKPTAYNLLKDAGMEVTAREESVNLTDAQRTFLESENAGLYKAAWHSYDAWAYSAPWVKRNDGSTNKKLEKKEHWFQTISMGSGAFSVEEIDLKPVLILLDQHGWEIVRLPIPSSSTDTEGYAKISKYNSPMVSAYHYWKPVAADKVDGYHKYNVSDPVLNSEVLTVGDSENYTTQKLGELGSIPQIKDAKGNLCDLYVTYDVKTEYANAYAGADKKEDTQASKYLVKQGGHYAKINSSNQLVTSISEEEASLNIENVPADMQWYVGPNFDIDKEMGYLYKDEPGAQDKAKTKDETEADYVTAGKNGFDPYNVQIQSVANTNRFFTTNSSSSALSGGIWTSTYASSGAVSLQNENRYQNSAEGYDHSTPKITNATFMVVDDGNGNMRLMPRFDNEKVVTSFTGLSAQLDAATAGDEGTGTQTLSLTMVPTVVTRSSDIKSVGGYYMLSSDFAIDESVGTKTAPFKGIIDGRLNTITATASTPFVAYADGATIRNVILGNVSISSGNTDGHAGAIAATAKGATRIYNCGVLGGSVSGTAHVGGIVGHLEDAGGDTKDGARVINCFSYANVGGGTDVGGIVGFNKYKSSATDLRTMVMNCMFYGNITSGTRKSPVYGGENINNIHGGLNTFNYYSYENLTGGITSGKYNCALAVEEKYLTRFEFYRLLLNSNKKLAAFYATGSPVNADKKMAKWVLETADKSINNPKPYPVLKAQGYYPSIINYDAENAPTLTLTDDDKPAEEDRNKGGKLGNKTLTVNIAAASTWTGAPSGADIKEGMGSFTLYRTDKDFARFNYNYDKVQLPYYNDVGTGNYTDGKVVTGWKITAITAVANDPYTSSNYPTSGIKDFPDHNYADRKSSNKDKYDVSGRVFSQGAYFDVPYGVESITIEPYWGNAAFVADKNYDVVYNTNYGKQDVTQVGTQVNDNTKFNDKKVYTSMSAALGSLSSTLSSTSSVYDNAIVLVGNFHQNAVPANDTKPFTIMSVDEDNDHEPDYSMIYHHNNRKAVSPIRFDFINIPGTAQAQKPNGTSTIQNFTIFLMRGWFETTNTCIVYSNQVEYENSQDGTTKVDAPLILLGGDFEQFVSTRATTVNGKTIYIHVGGNVKIKSFGLGTHSDGQQSTPHVPVSVTGGEYEGFYLTGTYNPNAAERTDNAECYISGGHFVEAAGACQEPINGNVQWQIYNADIDAFYGGGINDAKPIKGTITTDIFNSHVGTFCGGPKFGNMTTGKDVTTNATGCVFDEYFGAGYGGLSYSRQKYYDLDGTQDWTTLQSYYTTDRGNYFDGSTTGSSQISGKDYGKKGPGVATDFDYEFFVWSSGKTGARFFVKFASFSLAQCDNVFSTLTGCTINGNFYGGGSLGAVIGKATSVLDDCTVNGNVFGGGYSASLPKVEVRDAGFVDYPDGRSGLPNFNLSSGMFEPGNFSGTTPFEWKNATASSITLKNGQSGSDLTNHYLYTDVDLTALGKVGETDLTVMGNTTVTGSVFGGGDESAISASTTATGNTKVTIEKNESNEIPTISNVYGGGNTADVDGNTDVTMTNGTVSQDIFGGGKGRTTVVGGNVTVNIGPKGNTDKALSVRDVYGGSAFGAVNAKKDDDYDKDTKPNAISAVAGKTTTVTVYGGTVDNVYGGGLGQVAEAAVAAVGEPGNDGYVPAKDAVPAIVAKNFGTTTVNMEGGQVNTAVYGGANVNGILKGDVNVNMLGGTVNTAPASTPTSSSQIKDVVFGGGYGQPTIVEGDITVTIGTQAATPDNSKPTVYGNVYGGSALGKVQVSEADADQLDKKIDVNLYGGTIHGNVFGGGLGQKASVEPVLSAIEARVGGNVNVLLDGAKFNCIYAGEGDNRTPVTGQIFGCNNLNGTPKGHVKVHVKRTVDSTKDTGIARDDRKTYDVAAVYGGGNMADYIPTDATITLPATDAADYTEKLNKKNAARAEVIIEGCDKTSIGYVYGGGNAAAVPATDVTILGSYIIDYVFGGGNGKSTATFTNPGANIGRYNNGATDYGSGKAVTKFVGGHVHCIFGGSDTKGNVRGGTSLTMPETSGYTGQDFCTIRDVKQMYGAGNQADQDGNVTLILGCVNNMDNVYGGARNANVKGGVDLVVTSGHFKGVFGGNDLSGTIQGPITLTIEETGCDPLVIDNLYLGGNQAAYSVYGYKNVAGTLTARTKADYDEMTDDDKTKEGLPYADPVLNIVSCTSIGNAFGGGYGNGAVMYGSPTVNVDMIPGKFAGDIVREGVYAANKVATTLGTIGNVYGGGEEANVVGNTTVNICTADKVAERSSMGAPITGTLQDVQGALITGNVFGAGKGLPSDVNSAMVSGSTTITMTKGSVAKSVYGGGELSQVDGSTSVTVSGGTIGTTGEGGATYGNIYGGGFGKDTNVDFGLVKGNATINVSGGSILHNIYGGGAYGSVGTFTRDDDSTNDVSDDGMGTPTACEEGTGTTTVTITGGTIGTNGQNNGMVFGSSRGDIDAPQAIHDHLAWVNNANVVVGATNAETGPDIKGSLYGSGENGHTFGNATVTINKGTIGITDPEIDGGAAYAYRGNVYGGGCGTDKYYTNTSGVANIHDGKGNKYNPLAGIVRGTATVTVNGGHVVRNLYGAGSMGSVGGKTTVTVNDGIIGAEGSGGGYVYAAARGDDALSDSEQTSVGASELRINGGTVWGDAFGGGQAGIVNGAVDVSLTGGEVKQDVYGGGALAKTNIVAVSEGVYPATNVTLAGTTIAGNLYGGGLGRLAVAGVAGTPAVLYADEVEYNAAKGTSLTAKEFAALTTEEKTKTPAVEGVAAVKAVEADVNGPVTVSVTGGEAANVFGCNNINGAPQSTVEVNISGGKITNNVYGGGNQAKYSYTDADHPLEVKISGGVVNNDVFGGGLSADVAGSIKVSVSGSGKVINDVYGGGALANTNTANWDTSTNTWKVSSDATEVYYIPVKHITPDITVVTGYYTGADDTGLITTADTKAAANTAYYKRIELNKEIHDIAANGTTYKTTVNLTGGTIGNAYGGGLGKLTAGGASTGDGAVQAMVYGDVEVKVERAAFTALVESSAKNAPVTGRVFGCNNINGTPKGEVTVTINETARIDGGEHTLGEFEIQGVYGGGNLSDYEPETYDGATEFGQNTNVVINSCDASISKVYGGGNAAKVPFTDVTVKGAFEIGYVFGGGNGGDMIYKNGSWIDNTGADVTYSGNVLLKGGTIGQAFGGSDSRGTVYGGSSIKQETGGLCPLRLVNLYGAGNGEKASMVGDITIDVSGCGEYSEIQNVYGGSYKADITGSVTLNIKSGIFTSVFGGNDRMGSIGGPITVNIEETDNCDKPIIIQNLYGGCYQTAYPGANAKTWNKVGDKDLDASYTSYTTGKITVNVRSATRIDRIFGGSERGDVTGDTEVNINMVRGSMSGKTNVPLPSHYTTTSKPANIEVTNAAGYVTVYGLKAGESSVEGYYYTDVYTKASGTAVDNTNYYRLVPVTFAEIPSAEITVETTDVSAYYTRDGDTYTQSSGTAVSSTTYYKATTYSYNLVDGITSGTDVSSYYTHSTVSHTLATGTALPGITYYKPSVKGNILAGIGTIGDVFGGGNIGKVTGNTTVNICTSETVTMETIDDNPSTTDVDEKQPKVLGAHIYGDVFGGCNNATVTGNTTVNIGTGDYSSTANFEGVSIDKDAHGGGSVYGGGNQGDVLGNTSVTMEGGNLLYGVYVYNGIFGGGYSGSVGTYTRSTDAADVNVYGHTSHTGCIGKPKTCTSGGTCTVVVMGGQIGPVDVATQGMPVPQGWVWGGGSGVIEDPSTNPDTHFKTYVNNTDVTIGGTALIMESVIGGGEFGRVLGDTKVTVTGGQIGVGDNQTVTINGVKWGKRYDDADFINPATATAAEIEAAAAKLPECSFFEYGRTEDDQKVYLPYDPYYETYKDTYIKNHPDLGPASTLHPSDGKTWIGCVFGGGSGYMPYIKDDGSGYDWCHSAGWVEGNSTVEISGGHILTNVYGANEVTDVKGKATVKMTGGTIGVPRTLTQIAEHPLSCYLFGAGKGDQRSHFYNYNNVGSVLVDVSGGIIYGSVFGGAEDGHVLGDVTVNIKPGAVIGTWGTSYVDGNVFGGGRGYAGTDYTAGNVGGSININITGGTMLGSIYGGGRLGSVGYGLFKSNDANYGRMLADDKYDDVTPLDANATSAAYFTKGRGHIDIDIDGSTNDVVIGNKYEFQHHPTEGSLPYMPSTDATYDSDRGYYMLNHTRGGNVFGGGMGRREKLGSTTDPITELMWQELGRVKSTKLNIHGSKVWIKGNVYGGGEFGAVTGKHKTGKDVSTEIIIDGATIGTVMGTDINSGTGAWTPSTDKGSGDTRYSFGSVFGGGYGTMADVKTVSDGNTADIHTFAALVGYDTDITMTTGTVRGSIYGGGELACVEGNTKVVVNGGSIGVEDVRVTEGPNKGYVLFGNWRMGNVFGGGKGHEGAVNAGLVAKNATVTITGGNVYHNVYGGGAIGSVGTYKRYTADDGDNPRPTFLRTVVPVGSPMACEDGTGNVTGEATGIATGTATVTITGGQIGINGWDNGMVNGSGRGDVNKPGSDGFDVYDKLAWVQNTVVTIGNAGSESVYAAPQPQIKGSLYGGGENGHNFGNSTVHFYSGTIGTDASTSYDNGNVYGSGCGIDTYTGDDSKKHHNSRAGFVRGSSSVNIHGGKVLNSVFGGGSMASIGEHGESATVNISGGLVDGSVYGGAKGDLTDEEIKSSAKQTAVNISGGTISGDVFGGGMAGIVENSVTVNMTGGTVGNNLYGGGALADTNTANWNETADDWVSDDLKGAANTTHVSLMGGTVTKDVYGGALGRFAKAAVGKEGEDGYVAPVSEISPIVYGDILVELNGKTTVSGETTSVTQVTDASKGCIVDKVFGSNDMRGTPMGHVKVHVFSTQHTGKNYITEKVPSYSPVQGATEEHIAYLTRIKGEATGVGELATNAAVITSAQAKIDSLETAGKTTEASLTAKDKQVITDAANAIITELEKIHDYDVTAVYGGGDLAPYMPKETGEYSEVVIDGCQTTSIQSVYGGGNAASTPATKVRVNACFLIEEVFGGGNGKDNYTIYDEYYENPGADVGYKELSYYDTSKTITSHGTGSEDNMYKAIVYDNAKDKEGRQTESNGFLYGSGQATTEIVGGRIIEAYGGSNQKGNIRTMALSQYQESEACAMHVGTTYGAGKSAEIDGDVSVKMDCVKNVDVMYGGSENADMNSGVTVNITNGTFNKVFGGNNVAGTINGPIIINVEEKGCQPIFINELYGGGYYAPYSVYGFKKEADGTYETIEEDDPRDSNKKIQSRIALEATDAGALTTPHRDPQINIISATRIGAIYGGGYKALMIGNPHINVNMQEGTVLATYANKPEASADFSVGTHGTGDYAYVVTKHPVLPETGDTKLAVGTIGNIYGGGNEADIHGNTYVDIGTGKWLDVNGKITTEATDGHTYYYEEKNSGVWKWYDTNGDPVTTPPTPSRNAAHISGTVFGGGNQGYVQKNTYVTMDNGTVETAIYGGGNEGDVGIYEIEVNATTGSKTYNFTSGTGVCNVTINGGTVGPTGDPTDAKPGNVFGAGAGSSANFECDKAMADNANVTITGGTVKGNVYGGGMIARLENNTNVTIGREGDDTSAPVVKGYVYGAGQGVATHGYSGLVRGNSTVTVQGKAKVESSIYGGGELATVGKYVVEGGIPVRPSSGGTCTVTVRDYAEVGRNDMVMTAADGPDDWGHVFGGGKGATPYEGVTGTPYSYKGDGEANKVVYTAETDYLKYLETLALASNTDVTIGGHAFVKGSVYGGSENGIVQADTHVKIQDNCQIGNGYAQMDDDGKYLATKVSVNRPYTDAEWAAGHLIPLESDPAELKTLAATYYNSNSLPECASWPYGKNTGTEESPVMKYLPYDVYDLVGGVPVHGSDGHTFYGNVFGGGSGYYPYKKKDGWTKNDAKSAAVGQPVDKDGYSDGVWHRAAGAVYGNTTVEITGGHILTSVYGGNEMTDVGKFKNDLNGAPTIKDVNGKCTVKMSGGTLGVPRTLKQIAAHPVTCYLFGAGKGDQRINFNTWTNVNDAVVEVSDDARIYGSVFGGGEDGHVLADTRVDIKTGKDVTVGTGEGAVTIRYPYIGTTGTSYVDGNIFGGGRGFSGEALTAGSVGGNVQVNISDGTILGSVYGGGRLASVGTGFTAVTDPHYGQLQADYDTNVTFTSEEISAAKEGDAAYGKTTSDIKAYAGSHGHVTVNISGGTIGNDLEDITVEHTKGGNVFGGSMGRLTLLDGSISPIWPKMAVVKSSKINISGDALIKGNVYGGGELGMVRGDAYVTIGGVLDNDNTKITSTDSDNPTIMRDVYGGGYGSDDFTTTTTITAGGFTHDTYTFTPMQLAGIVCGDTYINIKRGHVQKNVYGGGEMATVGLVDFTNAEKHDNVTKSFALSWPYKMSFIPYDDSGISSAIGGSTYINVSGGRLGLTGKDFMGPFDADGNAISATDRHVLTSDEEKAARLDNGDVYGGGKGLAGDRYDYAFCANVKETHVTINYPANNGATPANYKDKSGNAYTHDCVAGAVYGGGEDGHVIGNTEVTLTNGLVGHAIYGGGSGKGKYKTTIKRLDNNADKEVSIYSLTAGKVYGNTKVEMTGGYVVRNIYGGGNMGSVGKGNYSGGADDYSTEGYGETITGNLWTTAFNSAAAESESNQKDNAWHFLNSGKTSVKVTGGQVGYIDPNDPTESMKDGLPYGCIFGGCRGESAPNIAEMPRYLYSPEFFSGYVNETDVVIGKAAEGTEGQQGYVAASGPTILGSVFGGGQDGHVRRDTHVTVYGGEIGIAYNDDNRTKVKTSELDIEEELGDAQWLHRGNVYGAGSGIGQYKYDFNYDEDYDDKGIAYGKKPSGEDDHVDEQDYSTSAGSVSRFTQVDILGGTIHRNVYGGGSLSSVGAPKMGQDYDLFKKDDTNTETKGKQSQCTVNIGGGASLVTIGTPEEYQKHYGGEVYGASRGMKELDAEMFGTTIWTRVNIYDKVKIMGNVFGGGDAGMVKKDSEVRIGDPKE